jgi:hypothetical protein
MLSMQSGPKQGDDLFLIFFFFAFEYAIRKVQKSQIGMKLNGK